MGQLTLSSKLAHTMAKIFVLSLLVAVGQAAPHVYPAGVAPLAHAGVAAPHALGYAAAPVAAHGLGYAAAPAHIVGTSVQEHIHAGPAVAHTTHEVVGHKTVQVGTQAVQTGHAYTQHAEVSQAPAYTYIAEPAKTSQSTVPIAPPVIPAAPAPYVAIPPAPTNQVTRIEPELEVKKYIVEVPVAVPVPVEREVIVEKHVAKPYPVEVPQPYAVPQPYKVHPVHKVVETPVIDQHHVTVHQPVAVAHHAIAAPALHAGGYAHHAVAAPVAAPVAVHAAAYQPAPALHAGAYAHHAFAGPALAHHAGYPIVAAAAKAE